MKLDPSFYRHTLLPNLYKAKESGVDILSKSALLAHFTDSEAEKVWVCCASATDIEETFQIVSLMKHQAHDVLANLNIRQDFEHALSTKSLFKVVSQLRKTGKNELADKLYNAVQARTKNDVEELNTMLWKNNNFSIKHPNKADDNYIKELAKKAFDYLKDKANADDELIKEAVIEFLEQNYFSEPDFKGEMKPNKVFADFYYKNRGDDLDDLEINSDVSDREVELGMRELKKYL